MTTRAPALFTPTITWPRTSESAPGKGSAPVAIGRSRRTHTGDEDADDFAAARRVLQADERAIGPDGHRAASAIAHDGFEDAGGGGLNGRLTVAVPPPTLMVIGTLAAGATIAGDLESELFHAVHVAHAEMGAATLFTVDRVGSQAWWPRDRRHWY